VAATRRCRKHAVEYCWTALWFGTAMDRLVTGFLRPFLSLPPSDAPRVLALAVTRNRCSDRLGPGSGIIRHRVKKSDTISPTQAFATFGMRPRHRRASQLPVGVAGFAQTETVRRRFCCPTAKRACVSCNGNTRLIPPHVVWELLWNVISYQPDDATFLLQGPERLMQKVLDISR